MSKAYQLTVLAIALASALSACRNRDGSLGRRTQEYEVITEGSANGVTSTVSAPGESPTPLVAEQPITDTNADTTTAFSILDSTVTTGTGQPGSLADTLPQEKPPPRVYRPAPRPSPEPETPSVVPPSESEPAPQPEPERHEPEQAEPQQPAEDSGEDSGTSNPE